MNAGSIQGVIAEVSEPRRGEPRLSLNLLAGVRRGNDSGNAQILNISRSGFLLQSDLPSLDHQPITVIIPGIAAREAHVVWSSGRFAGCRFDQPLRRIDLANSRLRSNGPADRDLEPIGPRIKRLREEAGLSMVGMARTLGVSKPTVWKWETGRMLPSRDHFQALCGALRVTEVELAYGHPGEIASSGDRLANEKKPTLAEAMAQSRKLIAEAAGVEERLIQIAILTDQTES